MYPPKDLQLYEWRSLSNSTGVLEAVTGCVQLSGNVPSVWIILLFRVGYCVQRWRLTSQKELEFRLDISRHDMRSVLPRADLTRGFNRCQNWMYSKNCQRAGSKDHLRNKSRSSVVIWQDAFFSYFTLIWKSYPIYPTSDSEWTRGPMKTGLHFSLSPASDNTVKIMRLRRSL